MVIKLIGLILAGVNVAMAAYHDIKGETDRSNNNLLWGILMFLVATLN